MKIEEQREDVMVGGAETVNEFTIKASAKAFQILSSNLYSNPLGSMIRELSTNAYDAHVDSNKKEIPFVITLPNSLEPTFKVRDFGTGLSEDEIYHVYTTFFESTKTNSNDVVGCLGLGSKSPFGVADSFTISSYQNGKKTIYSAFLNDERIPNIAKFGVFDTKEENGLEVEVAIKESDFRVFNREVNTQLKYFKVKPVVKGNVDFKWDMEEEYLYEGTNWKMVKGGNTIRVLQGQVQYPVSINDMGTIYENASSIVKSILNSSILFEVGIGEVNIAPSREALSYDTRTSKNIIKAAEKIAIELPKMISLAIQNCDTEYEAKLKCYDIINGLGRSNYSYRTKSLSEIINTKGNILWNGKSVSSTEISVPKDLIESATYFSLSYRNRFQKSRYTIYSRKDENGDEQKYWEMRATPLKRTVWIYSTSEDKAVEGRAKQYFKDNFNSHNNSARLIIIKTDISAAKLAEALGLKEEQLVIASTLDKVRRKNYGQKKVKTADIEIPCFLINDVFGYKNKTDLWPTVSVKKITDLTGFYVDLDRFDVFDNNSDRVNSFSDFVKGAIELGFITDKDSIYGLRKINRKKKHNLVNLFTFIKENKSKITLKPKYVFGHSDVVSKMRQNFHATKKIGACIADDSPIKKVIDAIISMHDAKYNNYTKKLIDSMQLHETPIDMTKECEQLDQFYPMISQLNYYYNTTLISQYIIQMDKLREFEQIAQIDQNT